MLLMQKENLPQDDVAGLKKYRHVIACMIDASLGYFTPVYALRQIQRYREGDAPSCEWYSSMDREPYAPDLTRVEKTAEWKKRMRRIHRQVLEKAVRNRHHNGNHCTALSIVDRNIEGFISQGASWF